MSGMGGYVWFVGLGGALALLAAAFAYARLRPKARGGDPNAAWKQAANESGHPEVARPEK